MSNIDAVAILSAMPTPEKVRAMEDYMLQFPQVDLSTTHLVFGGMYARTILIPAGTMLTGALTELANICVMCGDITVTTDDGTKRLTGFHVLAAKPGAKRAGIAHSDTYWTTLIPTDLTDITDIEESMTTEAAGLQTRRGLEFAQKPVLEH
jgi:hypothetical protein